jgi:Fe-Mn family superoxide dismutase
MKFELITLPFEKASLAPHISKQTIDFHYGKHHQGYVNNLNALIEGTKFENADLKTIIKEASGSIFNNAAQVWNHNFYFQTLSAKPKTSPEGKLLEAINKDFGSIEGFRDKFDTAALSLFGSGWVWLSMDKDGHLVVTQESNAGNPLRQCFKPLITCDVWEHAYYLDYQNRRADYVKNFWDVLDWNVVEQRF